MKNLNKKQLLVAVLALPILLVLYWIFLCQITSGAEHVLKLPVNEGTHLIEHDHCCISICYKDLIPSKIKLPEKYYVAFRTDENGISHPSGARLFPSLCNPSIINDKIVGSVESRNNLMWCCADGYETDEKNYFWIDRIIAKAFEEGREVNAIIHVKNYRSEVSSIEIDGKDVVTMIPDALQYPDKMLDSMATRIGKELKNECSVLYCDPQNKLNFVRELMRASVPSYLRESVKYLWNERKKDTAFVAMVQEKTVKCYFAYEEMAKNDMLSNAVSQLASSYNLVNEENYKALYDIFTSDEKKNEDDEFDRLFYDYNRYYDQEDDSLEQDSSVYDYATKIKALTHNDELTPKTLDNIGFWVRRWNDGSAETIRQIMEKIEKH